MPIKIAQKSQVSLADTCFFKSVRSAAEISHELVQFHLASSAMSQRGQSRGGGGGSGGHRGGGGQNRGQNRGITIEFRELPHTVHYKVRKRGASRGRKRQAAHWSRASVAVKERNWSCSTGAVAGEKYEIIFGNLLNNFLETKRREEWQDRGNRSCEKRSACPPWT